jgi:Ran-binding protein 9/10
VTRGGAGDGEQAADMMKLPTRWSQEVRHPSLSVSTDGRELTFNGLYSTFIFICCLADIVYLGPSSNSDKDAATARTDHPIPPACGIFYYEVEIVSKGQKGCVSLIDSLPRDPVLIRIHAYRHISIGFAAGDVKLSRLPGWEKNSWGYHGDDGSSFAAEKNGTPYGPKFGSKFISSLDVVLF